MAKYASGKHAYAISDRSGFRYKYRDMRKEWNGMLVGKDEYEPKQPQLGPFRSDVDPQALRDARPDRTEPLKVFVGVSTVLDPSPVLLIANVVVGDVTVTTS
jgi:hypothetical protein